jgi:hypothetical protein
MHEFAPMMCMSNCAGPPYFLLSLAAFAVIVLFNLGGRKE